MPASAAANAVGPTTAPPKTRLSMWVCRAASEGYRDSSTPRTDQDAMAPSAENQKSLVISGGAPACVQCAVHFEILREAGLTERLVIDGLTYQRRRRDDLEATIPGLLDSVVPPRTNRPALAERCQSDALRCQPVTHSGGNLHSSGRISVHTNGFH